MPKRQRRHSGHHPVDQSRSVGFIGPPGLGKTMRAICIATEHVRVGATARFVTANTSSNQLN